MFDILFGWRKASKCKKLIKRVQCRLKLLKNKRGSIVRQIREDVGQLLKHGHEQSAFDRVDQLFKDESIMAVYELLDHFCEFIIIHLSYIRRHKDCPNDINEAVSSLIFASARCGDLPELRVIRKLFGERYGQRLAATALELLPGNLVNRQIRENLSIKSVPADAKYRLVDEIARNCLKTGPLLLEYSSELQEKLANKSNGDQVPNSDLQDVQNKYEEPHSEASNIVEAEGKIVHVDFLSDGNKFLIERCHSPQGTDANGTSTKMFPVPQSSPKTVESSVDKKQGIIESCIQLNSLYESTILSQNAKESWRSSGVHTALLRHKEGGVAAESSSESSSQMTEEMIYLDDIEEFQSPMGKDGHSQDQRLFMFKSSAIPTREKFEVGYNEHYIEQYESRSENAGSRSSRKSGKAGGKRLRKRSVSLEKRSMKDVECESCENSANPNCKSHHPKQQQQQQKVQMVDGQKSNCAQERLHQPCCIKIRSNLMSVACRHELVRFHCTCSFNNEMVNNRSLEHPCYVCVSDKKDDRESPPWQPKRRITTLERFPTRDLKEDKFQHGIHYCRCSCNGEANNQGARLAFLSQTICDSLEGEAECWDYLGNHAASMCSFSRGASPWTRRESQPPYLRAMTMPPERPTDSRNENILRSNSFPLQEPSPSSSPHIHPKLPDYDELAAKFMALKKSNLQKQLK